MKYRELDIENIISLKSHAGISDKIAARQLKVVSKGFEYLSRAENNILYIADEVGLGKTYIGLGIATLLRHASSRRGAYRDVVLVPKKNLQDKWLKELRNFVAHNYLVKNSTYEEFLAADDIVRDRLQPISADSVFAIFRMTSFSSVTSSRQRLREYLVRDVFGNDAWCSELLWRAYDLGYFNNAGKGSLLRLVSCMLNAMSDRIDCLIVDEAHNYKHGLGGDASNRNIVTSLFLGASKDVEILKLFPQLRQKMKFPLASKIICLSATPKDRDITEIKHQFDCLSKKHPLLNCQNGSEILERLPRFLIRGNMEYELEGDTFSRNQCRHEHRLGNVNLAEIAVPIEIGDGFESVFWQLLQYQSIRYLAQKPNASFEIGMLAGFESYQLDMDKRTQENTDDEGREVSLKEYEIVQHRHQKESEDGHVIRQIIDSYRKTFSDQPPPHPKLSRLEAELISQLGQQQKSLVFVRRIATVEELVKRLVQCYDRELVKERILDFKGRYKRFMTPQIREMLRDFKDSHNREKIEDAIRKLAMLASIKKWFVGTVQAHSLELHDLLAFCYQKEDPQIVAAVYSAMAGRSFSRAALKNITDALAKQLPQFIASLHESHAEEIILEEEEILQGDSFFKRYFTKSYPAGMLFKRRIYRENFFDLNLFLAMEVDGELQMEAAQAAASCNLAALADEKLKGKRFRMAQEIFREKLIEPHRDVAGGRLYIPSELKRSTFITELLLKHSNGEFKDWVLRHALLGIKEFTRHIMAFNALMVSIFQNGSGLLAAFVAGSTDKKFERELLQLIVPEDAPFHFVHREVMTVLRDYDLIISVNFQHLEPTRILAALRNMSPVIGASGRDKNRSTIATRFRMPGFPYIMVATDIFHEGEDLHTYCQQVYHYGIAWNPSGIEQRTGRIDRINSLSYRLLNSSGKRNFNNKVQIYYPYLSQSIEVNQVVKLLGHVDTFVKDFYDIATSKTYDSSVAVAEAVCMADIPRPLIDRLQSKYDVEFFQGLGDQ